jgi:uncharacterized membrane protein
MSEETTSTTEGPTLSERIMAFAGNPSAIHMSTELPDADASESEAADADQQGNQGEDADTDDGLDTTSGEEDSDADQDAEDEGEADETDQKENEGKGIKKRTLEERVAELAQKEVERVLAAREKVAQAEAPDFVSNILPEKVNEYVTSVEAQIDELRLEGKYTEARKLSRMLDQLDAELEANEAKRLAWEQKQAAKTQHGQTEAQVRKKLDDVAELYRAEMKVDAPTWDKMGKWFESQLPSKPLVVAEFNDILSRQGEVAAIRFAHEYTVKHMGKTAKESTEKKEQSKTKAAALTASTTGKQAPIDLKKAQAEFEKDPTPEAFAKYQAIKRQARAA